ncbi:MAG: glutamyl-tRNA reductase [Ruminococcus sp.]
MNCISISHKNADEKIRSRFAFPIDVQREISDNFSECVILCTCSRTEIYFNCEYENVLEKLSEYSGFSSCCLKKYAMIFSGRSAVFHLFRVASGIESMVIGEDEILGQLKTAYLNACDRNKTNREMNVIFQSAIACAKKIKTETLLSKASVSTATLTANEALKFCDNPKVLVIGASGKIGQTIVKNLLSHKNVSVTVTLRNHVPEFIAGGNPHLHTVSYGNRYEIIDEFDCVISATAGPHYTITYPELEKHLKTQKNRLFIDLAVPPDIDRNICDDKNIRLIGIDFFEELARENNLRKAESAQTAKAYISAEIETLEKNLLMYEFLNENNMNEAERKLLGKLKQELDPQQFSAFLRIVKKEKRHGILSILH